VFPGAWTAILVSLDNSGIWNLRAENLDAWYLGQELYLSVINPEKDTDEMAMPANTIYCGALSPLQNEKWRRPAWVGHQDTYPRCEILTRESTALPLTWEKIRLMIGCIVISDF
ncbi:hypothetical protein CRG98_024346, partial [Punica granatum]